MPGGIEVSQLAPAWMPKLKTGRYYALDTFMGSTSNMALTVNYLFVYPVPIYKTTSFDRISVQCQTGGGTGSVVRMGVYADDAGIPGALIADWGTVATTGTSVVEATISWSPDPGVYWIANVAQVGTQPTVYASINSHVHYYVGQSVGDTNFTGGGYQCETNVSGSLNSAAPAIAAVIARHPINKFRVA